MVDATITLQADFGAGFVDISADLVNKFPLRMRRGIFGNGPKDRVATPGSMTFNLNNSAVNSGAALGYYSPDHGSARSGFELGMETRLKLIYSGTDYYKFRGDAISIEPLAGSQRGRYTSVVATDYIDKLMRQKVSQLAVQAGKRPDEIITTLVAQMPTAPDNTSYATGLETFTYVLHDVKDESTSILNAITRAVSSSLGYFFVNGDQSAGEVLTYHTRNNRLNVTSTATLNDNMVELKTSRPIDRILNKIVTVPTPARVDAAAITILFSQASERELAPGETVTIIARYRDPNNEATRVAGLEIVDPLVADTDYKMSSLAGDGGNDMNGDLAVVITKGGNNSTLALTNNGKVIGYINLLQIRGKGLYLFSPVEVLSEDGTSQSTYGERTLVYKLPYQDSLNIAKDFADHFLAAYKDPVTFVDSIEFIANTNATLMTAALAVEIGDQVTITETVTGLAAVDYFVNGIELVITGSGKIMCKWIVTVADTNTYWILGDATDGKLDVTTALGV